MRTPVVKSTSSIPHLRSLDMPTEARMAAGAATTNSAMYSSRSVPGAAENSGPSPQRYSAPTAANIPVVKKDMEYMRALFLI